MYWSEEPRDDGAMVAQWTPKKRNPKVVGSNPVHLIFTSGPKKNKQ